jgi:hypothetical protein
LYSLGPDGVQSRRYSHYPATNEYLARLKMGWWKTSSGQLLGDGPMDDADELLSRVSAAYVDEHGRKPTLDELLETIRLVIRGNSETYVSTNAPFEVLALVAKTKAWPKRPKLVPGAVFSVPLGKGRYAFGKLTPQSAIADFYRVVSRKKVRASLLESHPTFRLSAGVPDTPFRNGRWVVYDAVAYPFEGFKLVTLRMGNLICCGSELIDGFIDTSSETRVATEDELKTVPSLSIYNAEMAEHKLSELLRSAPNL